MRSLTQPSRHTCRDTPRYQRFWTADEDRDLLWRWEDHTLDELAASLGRSPQAVWSRAKRLGLKAVPQGYETVEAAAKRWGVAWQTIADAIKASGRRMRYAKQTPGRSRASALRVVTALHPDAVDEAMQQWMDREPLHRLVRREGLCYQTAIKAYRRLYGESRKHSIRMLDSTQAAALIAECQRIARRERPSP